MRAMKLNAALFAVSAGRAGAARRRTRPSGFTRRPCSTAPARRSRTRRSSCRDPKSRRSKPAARPTPTYDLGQLTVVPGLIDVHAHVGWHFDKDGRYAARPGSPAQEILYSAENAYVTLMAGFTTIQSPGQANDVELRDGDRARRVPRAAHPDLDPPDQRAQRHARRDPPEGPPAQDRRRRRHQDLRVRQHPRRRQADDDRRAAGRGVRRGQHAWACGRWSTRTARSRSRRRSTPAASRSSTACSRPTRC